METITRRNFNSLTIKGVGGAALLSSAPFACAMGANQDKKKLGIALVGLGSYSTYQLAPALQDTQYCYLAGIVTGTPDKEKIWADKYGIPEKNIYNYQNFDDIANNKDIDVVYVVLPNSMHAEFSIRAAKAGKHVICEKPMGISVAECDAIINACEEAGVKLGMGYRLHSEPYTQQVKEFVREKTFGDILFVSADAAYRSTGNPNQWRLNKELSGGGALMNMGVYAVQSTIYGTGENPISVAAQEFSTRPEYFKETDETITAQFEFPSGAIGNISTSHNFNANAMYASGTSGWFRLQPANNYGPLSGVTSNGDEIKFPHESQQKLQMDDFARHVLFNEPNKAPGEMGKRDMMIVEAIYKSIANGGATIALDFEPGFGFGG
ncbi:MAG: Gfo/Idh/MocA family oxidoreductase [Bacteroidota bacterium]|uniref:Gfo/Idh/MocA family oxidoreductase n=1 Tax=Flagellimonas profundi TaxID=2915620 RepID=A0ABS3FCH2_9FLAO|nr:Gfo/Idh/MocA family oxidoreductase [Allomuricauda profundi]MBO0340862.1 Gfo/Idh/MocA family oxidoreductase [Allomuricauda profundi]MEC7771970.1 Gfo/Idh/MocA family oxidoreductase [Bacteroidota bacterium]